MNGGRAQRQGAASAAALRAAPPPMEAEVASLAVHLGSAADESIEALTAALLGAAEHDAQFGAPILQRAIEFTKLSFSAFFGGLPSNSAS